MKAIRKAHAVDFWVWKEEWSKRQAAVELDKFSREIDARLEILVPFGDPRYLHIKDHCYVFPDEVIIYDEGRIYKYNRDDIDSKAFVKRYSVGNQGIPSKYAIKLKDTEEIFLCYGKEENTYKFGLFQSSEDNLVWFITEQEAQNFINKVFYLVRNTFETVQIEGVNKNGLVY